MADPKDSFKCRECGTKQTRRAARARGNRCVSKTCGQAICLFCGCTEETACFVSQGQLRSAAPDYCYFLVPGVCSNPTCIEKAYHAITPEEAGEAQRYYDESQPRRPQHAPTLYDLRRGTVTKESELAYVIINELLREDYAHVLASADVDVFDLIAGTYGAEITPLIAEMFREWNTLAGHEFFVAGESLLPETAGVHE